MTVIEEIATDIKNYDDNLIVKLIKKYKAKQYNICIKLEKGLYTEEQADRNHEKVVKILCFLEHEKERREQERAWREIFCAVQREL